MLTGIQIGDKCYIGNQGSIRVATVVAKHRSCVTVEWRNSVRKLSRKVGISYEPDFWIHASRTTSGKALPRFVCSPKQQEILDREPRIKSVITLLCPAAT